MTDPGRAPHSLIVDAAVLNLVRTEHFRMGSLVTMPVLYPSGASVVLEISGHGDRFSITDRGGGCLEAELAGAQRVFGREAARIAAQSGIQFDGREMFVAEAEIDAMTAMMKIVANGSQQATNNAVMKVAERMKADAGQMLYDRLVSVIDSRRVARDAEIAGSSTHQWRVSALVEGERGKIAFDAVSEYPTSAVWTATKFGDLARLDHAIDRVAVVSSREKLGDLLGVISPSATAIIELGASDATFRKLASAA